MEFIAFYLPQYHSIPENDLWWGKGFTEWKNVRSALPQFEGHYQPHVPHPDIGYYSLEDETFIEKQHAMALEYGVSAFCYYYYNFSGKTLLEKPLQTIYRSRTIKNRFCLCWANQSWSRVWYGQGRELLLEQTYSPDEALQVIKGLAAYWDSSRYIKIDGKPLVLVYNPDDNPLMREYAAVWQGYARKLGYPGVYVAVVKAAVRNVDPAVYGADAAVEFAPDWTSLAEKTERGVFPRLCDYKGSLAKMLARPVPPYKLMRCVFPTWDNTPRYKGRGIVFTDPSPGVFSYALDFTVKYTKEHLPQELQYVFINAWNEWGEGCHLEPDEKNGYLYLELVKEAAARAGRRE